MLIAVDVGYSHVKWMATNGKRGIFPSVVGNVTVSMLELVNNGYATVTLPGGEQYYVGSGALDQSLAAIRLENRSWVTTKVYQVLFLAALCSATRAINTPVNIMTGLPVSYFGDKYLLENWVTGSLEANNQVFHIQRFMVIPQGLAAVLSVLLTETGEFAYTQYREADRIGILDVGGHTVNTGTFIPRLMRDVPKKTGSVTEGTWKYLQSLKAQLGRSYPEREWEDHEVARIAATGRLRIYSQAVDVSALVGDAMKPLGQKCVSLCTSTWGDCGELGALLLAGGGAPLIVEAVQKAFPRLIVDLLPDPQWSNCEGYLRLARRLWAK